MGYTRDLHPDDLVFLLQGSVDIDFRTSYYKISHGIQPITLSESAAARNAKAMALPFVDAKDMVTGMFEDRKVLLIFENIRFLCSLLLFSKFVVFTLFYCSF